MPPARETPRGSTRRAPAVLLMLAAALLVARIGTGIWEQRGAPEPADRMQWRPIANAEAESRASGRPVLYEFSAAWCGPCNRMAAEVFAYPASAGRLGSMFVPVHVVDRGREDGRNPPEVQALQDRFHIDAFPTLVVCDPATGRHETITGYGGRTVMMRELMQARAKLHAAVGARDSS